MDCEGVLLDMLGAIKQLLPSFKPENVESYDFSGDIGVSRQEVFDVIASPEVYEVEEPYPGVEDALNRLRTVTHCEAYTVVHDDDRIFRRRVDQLKALGLEGHIFSSDAEEKEKLEGYDVLFEDSPKVVEKYKDAGMCIFLIDHTYNQDVPESDVIRCKDFPEAVDTLIAMKEAGKFDGV